MNRVMAFSLFIVLLLGVTNAAKAAEADGPKEMSPSPEYHQTNPSETPQPEFIKGVSTALDLTHFEVNERINVYIRPNNSQMAVMTYSF